MMSFKSLRQNQQNQHVFYLSSGNTDRVLEVGGFSAQVAVGVG